MVAKSNINGAKIPPGQLISFVQKGIMYQELERSVADDGSVAGSSEPFSLLRASDGTAGKASPSEGPPAKKHKSENDSSRGAGSSRGGVRILLSRGSKPARLHLQRGSKPARLPTFSAALCGVGSMVCLKQLNPLQCTRPTDMLL